MCADCMLLHDKLKNYRVILASGSPRRRELLAGIDIAFEVADGYQTDESFETTDYPEKIAQMLAMRKSDNFPYKLLERDILITADTTVIINGEILGKPENWDDAADMLRKLSDGKHKVVTGVVIRTSDKCIGFSSETTVKFRNISDEEIDYYVSKYKPMDKAGAYGIQEWIGYTLIESIEGSYFNVVGLPVQRLYVELMKII